MTEITYYTPPSDEIFEEIKKGSVEIWGTYKDPYKSEKLERIKDITNIGDNALYMVGMFDHYNQQSLGSKISDEAKDFINDRIVRGGGDQLYF